MKLTPGRGLKVGRLDEGSPRPDLLPPFRNPLPSERGRFKQVDKETLFERQRRHFSRSIDTDCFCKYTFWFKAFSLRLKLGNCDIDFFVYHHHCFHVMSPKFLKFKRVQNVAEILWKWQMQKWKITEMNKNGWNYHSLLSKEVIFFITLKFNFVILYLICKNLRILFV